LIALFLAWQRRRDLLQQAARPVWSGAVLVLVGLALNFLGQLASTFALQQYALVLTIAGLIVAVRGWPALRVLWPAVLVLFLMVPLPNFLLNNLSAQLQLISSQLGVWFIRLFGISVFVEGNVIDLGAYKLQVAEACDGLRYLFPLMTLGFIMAYFFSVEMWKRILLFVSAIPLTILMNSFRIGTIGVMVEHWGVRMAEGFLHDFQGWAVFMTSGSILVAEMMILSRIGPRKRPWREVFGIDLGPDVAPQRPRTAARIPLSLMLCGTLFIAFASFQLLALQRGQAAPQREQFLSFPTTVGGWSGQRDAMERVYLDALQLDDYVIANYLRSDRDIVNFYVAWYDSQRSGQSAHSPRACLPGGGWRITALNDVEISDVSVGQQPLRVNRAQIELGTQKQVAYYWFQQRGRIITNEYLVKWYLFWDALTRNRTDGALVRLVTPLRSGESVESADARLVGFVREITPQLNRYIPD
jgi:exosortase D (VPLPA-CTERM-specific)